MSGETNLAKLLQTMSPKLQSADYVFCLLKSDHRLYLDYLKLKPVATFMEQEGLTLVLEKSNAVSAGLAFESVFKCITLTVHSSLDAVGLTAAIATKLTEHGISANVIAAYYHDHIFVPTEKAETAMLALQSFQP